MWICNWVAEEKRSLLVFLRTLRLEALVEGEGQGLWELTEVKERENVKTVK